MKEQTEKTQEPQNESAQRIQQEPSTKGKATIQDNRPATVVQRKLKSVLGDSTEFNEEKAPTGLAKFQQIASQMGRQYGVDTSNLKATHNSSFPETLDAEATIQGNDIHFAPGMDTDYNMKHEVAHAIDNRLHGTPSGNQVVNGQRLDTTREHVADRMANRTSLGMSTMQRKENREKHSEQELNENSRDQTSHGGIIQRKSLKMSGVLKLLRKYGGCNWRRDTEIENTPTDVTIPEMTCDIAAGGANVRLNLENVNIVTHETNTSITRIVVTINSIFNEEETAIPGGTSFDILFNGINIDLDNIRMWQGIFKGLMNRVTLGLTDHTIRNARRNFAGNQSNITFREGEITMYQLDPNNNGLRTLQRFDLTTGTVTINNVANNRTELHLDINHLDVTDYTDQTFNAQAGIWSMPRETNTQRFNNLQASTYTNNNTNTQDGYDIHNVDFQKWGVNLSITNQNVDRNGDGVISLRMQRRSRPGRFNSVLNLPVNRWVINGQTIQGEIHRNFPIIAAFFGRRIRAIDDIDLNAVGTVGTAISRFI